MSQFKVYCATYCTFYCVLVKHRFITTAIIIFSCHNNPFFINDTPLFKLVAFNVSLLDVAMFNLTLFNATQFDVELF